MDCSVYLRRQVAEFDSHERNKQSYPQTKQKKKKKKRENTLGWVGAGFLFVQKFRFNFRNRMTEAHPSPLIKIRRVSRLVKVKPTEKAGPEVKPSSDPIPPNKRARPEGEDQGIRSEALISNSEPQILAIQDHLAVQDQLQGVAPEEKKPDKWIHFGPTYGKDTELNQKAKDSAWLHIVDKKRGSRNDYMRSIEEVGKEAMDCYDTSIVDGSTGVTDEFVELMAKDGCFFLQLALHILGAGALLSYPPSNPYLAEQSDSSSYIPAMFFIGNQIPYVVINALMKQSFFREVIRNGKWNHYPKNEVDLAKLALYRTVVEPQLSAKAAERQPPPSNVLEALHNLLLGSRTKNPISPTRDLQDPEIGIEDNETKFPNVGELKKSGIRLRKAKRGVTNIQFSNYFFLTYLHVPPLTIDGLTKDLLTSLVDFEQLVSESDRGVTAYIRFINELAPTYRDFVILRDKGIIHVKDEKLKSTIVVRMLDNLITPNKSNFTPNLRLIRRKIEHHKRPPWGIIGGIISFFTIVQTVLAIVAYVKPRT